MSVVIVGGHDRMVSQYKKICKAHQCKAKVFTQMRGNLSTQIGRPDLLILFTNTVSIKWCAARWRKRKNATRILSAVIPAAAALFMRFWIMPVRHDRIFIDPPDIHIKVSPLRKCGPSPDRSN